MKTKLKSLRLLEKILVLLFNQCCSKTVAEPVAKHSFISVNMITADHIRSKIKAYQNEKEIIINPDCRQFSIICADNANGQPRNSTAKNYSTTSYNIESGILSGSEKGEGIRHVNIDAVRDFMKRFPLGTDVRWRQVDDEYNATFHVDSNETMVAYKNNGRWVYTINRYNNEKMLPTEVRALVKKTYYDYTISHIDEVHHTEQPNTIYLVLIEDDKTLKTIRVCDGEMEEIHELSKE